MFLRGNNLTIIGIIFISLYGKLILFSSGNASFTWTESEYLSLFIKCGIHSDVC